MGNNRQRSRKYQRSPNVVSRNHPVVLGHENILARVMTTYKEREETEEDRPTEPSMKDLQREIQSVQMQLYHNNLSLNRIEQSL